MRSPTFPEHWRRRSALTLALLPLSLLYGAAVAARRFLYRAGLLRRRRLPVPVVVVGNIFVGGTGKTPLVLALVAELQRGGFRPGVLSSGYGGRRGQTSEVRADSDPAEVGDEPVLIASRSGRPVWSGRDRVAAARQLLAAHPSCDVLVCDDGLQHYRLHRDFEIDVMDERGHGNGLLLPAGPLREPSGRAVDARVVNGGARDDPQAFSMVLRPSCLYRLDQPAQPVDVAQLRDLRLHAVAGTGHPERFFETLRGLGLDATPHAFPDHHAFTASDLDFGGCDGVVMTEKDAVKCARLQRAGLPALYALRVDAVVDRPLFELVLSRVKRVRR